MEPLCQRDRAGSGKIIEDPLHERLRLFLACDKQRFQAAWIHRGYVYNAAATPTQAVSRRGSCSALGATALKAPATATTHAG
jgi:hypothetical protein